MSGIFQAITDFFALLGAGIKFIVTGLGTLFELFGKSFVFITKFIFDGSSFVPWGIGIFIFLCMIIGIIFKIFGRNFSNDK